MITKVALSSRTPKGTKAIRLIVIAAIPLIAWLGLCAERPWRLGFFGDDWYILLHPNIGSAGSFQDILEIVATRPASAPFIWLVQALADWSPARSQVINIIGLGLSVGFSDFHFV
jgi:hypothetical protein